MLPVEGEQSERFSEREHATPGKTPQELPSEKPADTSADQTLPAKEQEPSFPDSGIPTTAPEETPLFSPSVADRQDTPQPAASTEEEDIYDGEKPPLPEDEAPASAPLYGDTEYADVPDWQTFVDWLHEQTGNNDLPSYFLVNGCEPDEWMDDGSLLLEVGSKTQMASLEREQGKLERALATFLKKPSIRLTLTLSDDAIRPRTDDTASILEELPEELKHCVDILHAQVIDVKILERDLNSDSDFE